MPATTTAPMLPRTTSRLTLRAFRTDDAPILAAYRDDPEVARLQDWPLPYGLESAHRLIEEQTNVTDPRVADWVQIAVEHADELIGDVAVGLDTTGQLATIGYTLRAERQRQGFGREAVGAVVDALFERGIHRVSATLSPENLPSAMLLEHLGFRYEGRATKAAFVRGEWEDDDRYAILAEERAAWLARPRTAPADVRLVEITEDRLGAVGRLATHHTQERFVAPMAWSFAEALVPEEEDGSPVVPWLRAIEADGEPAGFMMLAWPRTAEEPPYLWRLLIDRRHQGRGIGARAMGLLIDLLRADGYTRLLTSWVQERGGPEPFYRKLGFVPTGEMDEDEHVGELVLPDP